MDKQAENINMTESEFERQYRKATKRGAEKLARLPKAVSACYDGKSKRIVLEMQNGVMLLVPVHLIQGLQTGDEKALSDFDLVMQGSQIHWHDLDVQFYIEDLLKGVFGTPEWMKSFRKNQAETARKGVSRKSEAKADSSRENEEKRGRPPKRAA